MKNRDELHCGRGVLFAGRLLPALTCFGHPALHCFSSHPCNPRNRTQLRPQVVEEARAAFGPRGESEAGRRAVDEMIYTLAVLKVGGGGAGREGGGGGRGLGQRQGGTGGG